ncbi:hypothetical protein ACFQL4_18190 [Halosimplex aquaticum]
MHVLVTLPEGEFRESFFPSALRERVESLGTVEWNPKAENFSEAELRERIDGVDVLVTGWGVRESPPTWWRRRTTWRSSPTPAAASPRSSPRRSTTRGSPSSAPTT